MAAVGQLEAVRTVCSQHKRGTVIATTCWRTEICSAVISECASILAPPEDVSTQECSSQTGGEVVTVREGWGQINVSVLPLRVRYKTLLPEDAEGDWISKMEAACDV